ncbi:MAG: hypothetical protein IIA50_00480 [Bacteroidetes bacterium]|nr:hypothetical protein [Bacteroidota bacterium]
MLIKTVNTLRALSMFCAGALLASSLLTQTAMAQEGEEDVTRIEVKDGKVYVNGEVVKELENIDAKIYFIKDGEGAKVFSFFNRDGNTLTGFFSDDDGENHFFSNFDFRSPRMLEFKNEYGDWSMDDAFPEVRHHIEEVFKLAPVRERLKMIGRDGFLHNSGSREIMKLEMKSQELARKIRRADDTDTADLEAKLDDLLNKIFDMKMDNQKTQVNKMSTELSKLRERIKERSGAREDVIRSRKRELLGQRDAYDW